MEVEARRTTPVLQTPAELAPSTSGLGLRIGTRNYIGLSTWRHLQAQVNSMSGQSVATKQPRGERERTEQRRGSARRARPQPSASEAALTLALDIGGSHLKAVVLGPDGRMMVDEVFIATPQPCPPTTLLKVLDRLIRPLPKFDRVSVGFPGFVRRGSVVTAPHLGTPPWQGFELAKTLSARLGKPTRVLNDAGRAGAWADRRVRPGDGSDAGYGSGYCLVPGRRPHASPRIGASSNPQRPNLR